MSSIQLTKAQRTLKTELINDHGFVWYLSIVFSSLLVEISCLNSNTYRTIKLQNLPLIYMCEDVSVAIMTIDKRKYDAKV